MWCSQTLCFDAGSLTPLPVVCNWPCIALGHAGPQPIVDPHTVSRNQSHIFTLLYHTRGHCNVILIPGNLLLPLPCQTYLHGGLFPSEWEDPCLLLQETCSYMPYLALCLLHDPSLHAWDHWVLPGISQGQQGLSQCQCGCGASWDLMLGPRCRLVDWVSLQFQDFCLCSWSHPAFPPPDRTCWTSLPAPLLAQGSFSWHCY